MEVVALVSGGKDSCFTMIRCLDYGDKATQRNATQPNPTTIHPSTNPPPFNPCFINEFLLNLVGCTLQVVALANLIPLDAVVDELDSYMYQTIVGSYVKCMGLPLFRRRIRGSTRDQGLKYNVTPGDEVEGMFALLSEVKRQIPSINAVSSGAIASDYQMLRVESVCSRLGLVSLGFLWKQDQTLLLEEMVFNAYK